jgi:hypothetical protein
MAAPACAGGAEQREGTRDEQRMAAKKNAAVWLGARTTKASGGARVAQRHASSMEVGQPGAAWQLEMDGRWWGVSSAVEWQPRL